MGATITSEALAAIHSHVAAEAPREACGLLLGEAGQIRKVSPTRNLSAEPETSFEIDPASLFSALREERAGGPALLGYYHSHPGGDAVPSRRDEEGALEPGRLWLIVGRGEARLWLSGKGSFSEVGLVGEPGGPGCHAP